MLLRSAQKVLPNVSSIRKISSSFTRGLSGLKESYRVPLLNQKAKFYAEVVSDFRWKVPVQYNIGIDICDKHAAGPHRNEDAIIYETDKGDVHKLTWLQLKESSDRFANVLKAKGVVKGDRVGILLSQTPEAVISHIAAYKLGAITVPLFTLFGPEALEYRLQNSGSKVVITDPTNLDKMMEIKPKLPELSSIIVTQGEGSDPHVSKSLERFDDLIANASPKFTPVPTLAEDPALIIYTSGTTGSPKGCLHAHRVLLGHLPGVEFPHNLFPDPKATVMYTPADWAWIGGLCDVLLPSLHYGVPVLAYRAKKYDPEQVFRLMHKYRVSNSFMPPTSLKMMRQVNLPTFPHFTLSIGSGGECLGDELLQWGQKTFGTLINEFYGQTEANLLIGNCSKIMPIKSGSMGKPIPGRTVEIVDDSGNVLPVGTQGNIAVKRPNPVIFLEYWKNPEATKAKFSGDWLITGDLGVKDSEGYFTYVGRSDDIIKSGGYRIGPSEIENCLLGHGSVAMAAAIGVPDALRNEIVKAFIVLKPGVQGSDDLKKEIQEFVKSRLAFHEYPRQIEFTTELPMTTTGKIIRKTLKEQELKKLRKE